MRALQALILCAVTGLACSKHEPAPTQAVGPKKPRVEITVLLDPRGEVPADAVALSTKEPPASRQMVERAGIHLAIIGLPKGLPAAKILEVLSKAVGENLSAGADTTLLVTTECLAELQPIMQKNPVFLWPISLVVGPTCDREVKPYEGATALVGAGTASRVRMTFDLHTRYVLRVEPVR